MPYTLIGVHYKIYWYRVYAHIPYTIPYKRLTSRRSQMEYHIVINRAHTCTLLHAAVEVFRAKLANDVKTINHPVAVADFKLNGWSGCVAPPALPLRINAIFTQLCLAGNKATASAF